MPALARRLAPPAGAVHIQHVNIRVLIVDDDALLRRRVRDVLERAGMDVEEAADAATAREAIQRTAADVLVLDFLLPGCYGLDLWSYASQVNAGLAGRTLLLTGVMDGPEREQVESQTELAVLAKPFFDDVLIQVIERLAES